MDLLITAGFLLVGAILLCACLGLVFALGGYLVRFIVVCAIAGLPVLIILLVFGGIGYVAIDANQSDTTQALEQTK